MSLYNYGRGQAAVQKRVVDAWAILQKTTAAFQKLKEKEGREEKNIKEVVANTNVWHL